MSALLARVRLPGMVVVAVATLALGLSAARVDIERDNQSLNARDATESATYDTFRATFGNDEDLLVAFAHPGLLRGDGLAVVDRVTRAVGALDGVRRVWSLTTAEELVAGDVGVELRPLVAGPFDDAAGIRARVALERNPDLTGWLVSADRRTAGLVVELEDRPGDVAYRARVIDGVRAIAIEESGNGVALHVTGVPVQKYDVAAAVDRDQRVLLPLAIVVLAATLAGFFRSTAGVLVPLGVAAVTVVWTVGAYGLAGHELNAITSLLPPVLLVVAIAASVHIYEAWRSDGGVAGDGVERATAAVRAIAVPAALCAVTTAQGFLSLGVSEIPAVRQFGVFAGVGAAVAFALSVTAAPAVLSWLSPPPLVSDERSFTLRLLDVTSGVATACPVAVLAVFFGVTVLAAAAIPRVRANTDLVGFLRRDAPLRRDTEFVDAHLGGTLPLDFVLARRDGGAIRSLDAFRRLEAVEGVLRARPGVTTVTSLAAVVRQAERAEAGDAVAALPADDRQLGRVLDLVEESGHDLVRRFAGPGLRALRVSVRLRSMGTAESAPLVDAMVAEARETLGVDYTFVPKGALYHVIRDSTRLVRQQVTSFGTAIVLVVAAIGVLFRSVTFTVLALIPNVMPIVWTGGLMGAAGIELSTGTAMIASAVLGLVVDDTIYYLAHYRRVYAGDARVAVRETTRVVGAPVTAASVSLVLGFWVGAFGSFTPTIYFSLLAGLTMIAGVVCDLLVLPASLVMVERLARRRRVR